MLIFSTIIMQIRTMVLDCKCATCYTAQKVF